MRFQALKVPLDGTNDAQLTLSVPMRSITAYADTSTVQLLVRPSAGSDFHPVNTGAAFTYSEPNQLIDPCVVTLRAGSAVTAYVVVGYP